MSEASHQLLTHFCKNGSLFLLWSSFFFLQRVIFALVFHNESISLFIIMTNSNNNNDNSSSCPSSSSSLSCGFEVNFANANATPSTLAQVPRSFFLPALPMANITRHPITRDQLAQIIQEALELVEDDFEFDCIHQPRVTARPQ